MNRFAVWIVAGVSVFSITGSRSASPDDRKIVSALDTQYQTAVRNHDVAAMDSILAEDFVLVTGRGTIYTKADLLAEARSSDVVYEIQEDSDQTVRLWGNTAVVTALLRAKGADQGKPFDYRLWFSDTYVRTPRGWRYAFGQSSLPLPNAREAQNARPAASGNLAALTPFDVIELRRYTTKEGKREPFARYFESYFPPAFEQLGAVAAGAFFERERPNGFTWIRGFHTYEARAIANSAFYYGPVWQQHRTTLNDLIEDSDNVLLLRSLHPERPILILPTVDPVTEPDGARGIAVAQIFPVAAGSVDSFARLAETVFARYRAVGAREAGVLVTLDRPNNFPQLPVRSDGPYLVWLGILKDDAMLRNDFKPTVSESASGFRNTKLLRGEPEILVLDPTPGSRMRWIPGEGE